MAIVYQDDLLQFGWLAWLGIYVVCSITMAFALTPTTFIALASGYFLQWNSVFPMVTAYLFAAILCFQFAKSLGTASTFNKLTTRPKVKAFLERAHQNELLLVISSKISPILPFALSNFLLASLSVSFNNFVLGSFLGMLPRTLLAIWTGSKIYNYQQNLDSFQWDLETQVLAITCLVMGIAGFWKVFKK